MADDHFCPSDQTLGPAVTDCRGNFDFTVRFEDTVLSLLPSSLFLILALVRVSWLYRPRASPNTTNALASVFVAKLMLGLTNCAITCSKFILEIRSEHGSVTQPAARSTDFVLSVILILLTVLEHLRSIRPSFVLVCYLSVSLLLETVITRTQWLRCLRLETCFYLVNLYTAAVVIKLVWLLTEIHGRSIPGHSAEELSGPFGLITYSWLNPLFIKGFKNVLKLQNLSALDMPLKTNFLYLKFSRRIPRREDHTAVKGQWLVRTLVRTLVGSLLFPALPRLALSAFRLCQPLLVNALLDHMDKQEDHSAAWRNKGYGLIGAAIMIYFGIAVSTAVYWYCQERFQTKTRGILVAAIYNSLTQMHTTEAKDAAAVTLMSTDIERIRVGLLNLHEFWATPVEVAFASWLLYGQLGVAFLAPLGVVVCSVGCSAMLNRNTKQHQKDWTEKIQTRISATAQMLVNTKQLKISALDRPVEESIQQLRVDEMDSATRFRRLYVANMAFGFTPMALCPLITFAILGRNLDTGTIFTSLAYMILLADPLGILFGEIPYLLTAFTCLERIQDFLSKTHRRDTRHFDNESPNSPKSATTSMESLGPGITVDCVYARWNTDNSVFTSVSFHIPPAKLTVIYGPVGSGKSTLCKMLLAEVPLINGKIKIDMPERDFRSAFCDQTLYIFDGTIRENIVGPSSFDESWYQEVVESTALSQDLDSFPGGDSALVGNSGMTLSGGQKQRISVARALYQHANFNIFDDSLSGLDPKIELQVFTRIFGKDGVLARRNATVVLATHNPKLLSMAQHVIILDDASTVAYQGDFDGYATQGLLHRPSPLIISSNTEISTPYHHKETKLSAPNTVHSIPRSNGVAAHNSFLSEQDRVKSNVKVYRYYLASLGRLSVILFILFGACWGFFYNFGYIWLRFWSNDSGQFHSTAFYLGVYAVLQLSGLFSIAMCFWTSYTMMAAVSGIILHRSVLQSVMHAPLSFLTTTGVGVITNLFSQDMALVDNELPMAVTNLCLDVGNALGLAALIATASPYIMITYIALVATLYFVQKVYLRTSRQVRLLDLEAKSPLYTHFLDTSSGLSTIRAFSWVQIRIDEAFRLLDDSQKPSYILAMVQRWLFFILQSVVAGLAILVVTLATQISSTSSGLTGASLIALMTFGDILNFIIRWWTQLETSIGGVMRLKALTETVVPETYHDTVQPVDTDWPLQGRIELREVSATYQIPHTKDQVQAQSLVVDTRQLVLQDISLSIAEREKVAVCGRSGSGKSSLILLLLRIIDPIQPSHGSITVDGVDLSSVNRDSVRDRIIAMSQDPIFLPGRSSLKHQLDPLDLATSEECHEVLKLLMLESLAESLTDFSSILDPESLSGGQRQLLNVARTILRGRIRSKQKVSGSGKGGILLLDEVSSNMDRTTEDLMLRVLMDEFHDYTVIMVSHRLEIVMGFDTVVFMDSGRVVEQGNPQRLIKEKDSHFGQLWVAEKAK